MAALTYLDFDLQIDDLGNSSYRAFVLTSPVGQAEARFDLPFSSLEIENFLLRIGRPRHGVRRINSPEMNEARKFGGRLYEAVFQGSLQACLLRSIDYAVQREQGIRLRLRLPSSLIELPWEYLYDPAQQRFLVHSTITPVVRYLDLPQSPKPLAVTLPLKVLVMIASPQDFQPLDVEAEWQKIKAAVAALEAQGLLQLTRLPATTHQGGTLAALQKQLRSGHFHIFHFVGHGGFDAQTQDGVLLFESDDGRSRLVSGNDLGTLLHDHASLRLALLNACEGARTTQSDPFAGVAQQLVRQGIPAVIAMQNEISDAAAIHLAHEFYDALIAGYPVDGALAEARKALFAAGNDIEWGTPVLYLRAQDGRLFELPNQPPPLAAPGVAPPGVLSASTAQDMAADAPGQTAARPAHNTSMSRRLLLVVGLAVVLAVVLAVGLAVGLSLWRWNRDGAPVSPTTTLAPQLAAGAALQSPAAIAQATTPATPQLRATTPNITANQVVSRTILLADASNALDVGEYAAGKRIYAQLLATNADDVEALLGLARAQRAEGDETEALRTLARAAVLAPNDPTVNYALGVIYYESFDDDQLALDHLTRALNAAAPALQPDILFYRAVVYGSQGDFGRAIADMDRLMATNATSDDYVRRAQLYQDWGDDEAAERDFTTAIEQAPNASKYYLYRADFLARLDRVDDALADYRAFLRLREPDEDQSEIERAERYLRLYDVPEAVTPALTAIDRITAGTVFANSVDGARYVYVPAGVFRMGLDEGGFDEKPQHEVDLAAFWIMQTEVTNEQYEKCVVADVCTPPFHPGWGADEFWAAYDLHPVTHVTWEQAAAYAEWAGGRLPTEAEWEKAARGSDGRRYPWGNTTPTAQRLNFNDHVGDTQPVGSYPDGASPYGALDMAGNVWEWVADWYAAAYYATSPRDNPPGPADGERRVLRGGAFNSTLDDVGAYYRGGAAMTEQSDVYGFRVVREAAPE